MRVSDNTKIEWTDATWNPITGCSVVSAGCKHCYAMKLAGTRMRTHPSREGLTIDTPAGPVWNGKVRFNEQWIDQPIRWRASRLIFVCAHGDLFHESVPDEWIDHVFAVMAWAPQHRFQVLTKRAKRMHSYFDADYGDFARRRISKLITARTGVENPNLQWPLPHVWLGVSVENQESADERIPHLLQCPAAVRFLSCEPLLGPLELTRWLEPTGVTCPDVCPDDHYVDQSDYETVGKDNDPICRHCGERATWTGYEDGIDWVIAGGESGHGARPMHPDWARSLRDQCDAAGVPFFFKQWGEFSPEAHGECVYVDGHPMKKVGKRAAGRMLDGVEHNGMPA
jgi:protein gp37